MNRAQKFPRGISPFSKGGKGESFEGYRILNPPGPLCKGESRHWFLNFHFQNPRMLP